MSNQLIVAGGNSSSLEQNCLSSIDVSDGLHGFKSIDFSLKERRRGAAIFRRDSDSVLIVGGCAEPKIHLSSCETINIKDDSGVKHDIFHFDEPGFSCAAYCTMKPNVHVIAGGYNGVESLNSMRLFLTDQTPQYLHLRALITRLKNSTAVPLDDENLLLVGGWDESRTLRTIFRYSLFNEQCNLESIMPIPLEGHSATKIGKNIYIVGGFDGISVVSQILRYNIVEKTSEILPTRLNIARENHGATTLENERTLIIAGGWDGQKALQNCELFEVLQEPPWLRPMETTIELTEARNKPAMISIDL